MVLSQQLMGYIKVMMSRCMQETLVPFGNEKVRKQRGGGREEKKGGRETRMERKEKGVERGEIADQCVMMQL